MRRGTTLLELATVLLLLGLSGAVALPIGKRLADRMAVVSAREALAGLVAEARTVALAQGGASVHLDRDPFRAWYQAAGVPRRTVALEGDLGVTMLVGRELPHEVRFDGLGLGQVASTTVRFRRGDAEAGLTLSSYGRARRW
jgi:Tfp pilus assembly major pilin PilA